MNHSGSVSSCDLLIIGAGTAGMTAAARAASYGLDTVVVGNTSGFYLYSGLMDFLGACPAGNAKILDSPLAGMKPLRTDLADHPYAKLEDDEILSAFDFVRQVLGSAGLACKTAGDKNQLVLTAAGTFKPTFMVPDAMAFERWQDSGLLNAGVVEFKGMKGFSAGLIAAGLEKKGHRAVAVTVNPPGAFSGDVNVTRLARRLESGEFLETVIREVSQKVSSGPAACDVLCVPAVWGIENHAGVMQTLQERLEMKCIEIPGLPPSIPGLRLKKAFERYLAEKKVVRMPQHQVVYAKVRKNDIRCDLRSGHLKSRIHAKGVVLASGRFSGGGLEARRDRIHEPVFRLPVTQPKHRVLWHEVDLFHPGGHAINKAGISTDPVFRPLGPHDGPVSDHLYAAGAILAGNDWVRLKSGAGVAMATAMKAVDHFFVTSGRGHV